MTNFRFEPQNNRQNVIIRENVCVCAFFSLQMQMWLFDGIDNQMNIHSTIVELTVNIALYSMYYNSVVNDTHAIVCEEVASHA